MKKHIYVIIFALLLSIASFAQQPTVGLQFYDENASEGLTLFSPLKNNNVYLINNCGGVVHQWEFSDKANRTAYLLPDGKVVRAGAEFIEIRDWDNQLLWSYSATELEHHHDIEPMPNGNILVISYDYYTSEEMESAGRAVGTTDERFRLDKILEIKPVGSDGIEIVWQWRFFDHLVQDIDPDLPNFGVVAESPGRLDVNYDNGETLNFVHVNGIDYNPALDQIIFSARNLDEVFIIDHSTTTEEAAGPKGDFLWRWGNPKVYQQGSGEEQKLYRQHDPKWIPEGFADAGKISLFNNHADDFSPKNSHVELLSPTIEDNAYAMDSGRFLPHDFDFSWTGEILGDSLYEEKQSGVLFLENGNFLTCESSKGRIAEVTKEGELLWVYKNPSGDELYQGGEIGFGKNGIFRAERYAPDYLDFSLNLGSSLKTIEVANVLSEQCGSFVTALPPEVDQNDPPFYLHQGELVFRELPDALALYSLSGKLLFKDLRPGQDRLRLNVSPGVYVLTLQTGAGTGAYKVLVD